jgi:prepilin-type N-terminal cleavage/methylation domain-containing protein
MIRHGDNRRGGAAFTLIELLVVMAITAILLGLIFGPLIQSFNLTNRARVQALTQDTARRAMEIGYRDLANGVFVFDNATEPINLWVYDKTGANVVALPVPYAMVDLVPPARVQDQSATLAPGDVDPTTGLARQRGPLALPVAPGRVIVRYFLGLRDNSMDAGTSKPVKPYFNFYNNPRAGNLNQHNPVILYRAVVSPYLPDGRVDERFFAKDATTGAPVIYDPNFFYDTANPPGNLPPIPGFTGNAQGYGRRWENWKAVARAMVPTDRADEVVHVLDDTGQPSYFTANGVDYPRLNPLVRFQPTYVGNDAGSPTSTSDAGNGAPRIAPSTYVEQYGHWTIPYRLYMYTSNLDANPVGLFYFQNNGSVTDAVLMQTWDLTTSTKQSESPAFLEPNQSPRNYGLAIQQSLLLDPATGAQLDPSTGNTLFSTPPRILFTTDARRGVVNCAFPDSVMLHASKANGYAPTPSTWLNDGAGPNGSLAMPNVDEINDRYKRTYANHNNDSSNVYRYIRLATPPSNGGKSPLSVLPNASIVPGSIVVTGPDMRPGPNLGKPVVYKQVASAAEPGWNEYRLGSPDNPVNRTDPDPVYQDMLNAGQDPKTIIFDSRPDADGDPHSLPTKLADGVTNAAPITVTYQFQTNLRGYTVKADYLTRQLMTLSLGVRLYDFNSGQPQQATLTQKIRVRNVQR